DLQQLRRAEKLHVRGKMINRVDETTLFDHQGIHPPLFRLDGDGQSAGSGADDNRIVHRYPSGSTEKTPHKQGAFSGKWRPKIIIAYLYPTAKAGCFQIGRASCRE